MSYIGTEPKDIRSFGRTKFDYTATQGQTAFTGADDDGKVLAFTVGQIEVYVNGILMDDSDFTTTGTGTVTLASAANLNDVINIVSFESNIPDNDYVPASGGTFTGAVTASGGIDVNGTELVLDADGDTSITADTDDRIDIKVAGTDAVHIKPTAAHGTGIGIGTNAPLRQLHISNTSANSEIAFTAGTSGVSSILFGDGLTGTDVYKGYLQYNHAQDKMLIATAAGSSINIDSAGRVTMPYQPVFYAYTDTTSQSSGGTMVFQVEGLDVTNSYNNSTGVFTAPAAGVYQFQVYVLGRFDWPTAVATNKYVGARLYKNGAQWGADHYQQNAATRAHEAISFSVIGSLAANDTVHVNVTLAAGAVTYGGNYSSFSGKLIA